MSFARLFTLNLGTGNSGIADLRAQLLTTAGADSGAAISTGFTEIASGTYLWYKSDFADSFRGAVKFYSNAAPTVVLAIGAINPEECEDVMRVRQKATNKITFNRSTKVETVYKDDGSTPDYTQTWADDGTTQTQGVKT